MIVLVLAFCTLMFELIISRISVFYLNYANSFLAIPLTLFGLALGSLKIHLSKKPVEEFNVSRHLFFLTLFSILCFVAVFLLFSQYFNIVHRTTNNTSTLIFRTMVFVLVFIPPFYLIGKILTALYANYRQMIGRIYGMDLIGASAACCVTPVLFHFIDLPYLIFFSLLAMTGVTAISYGIKRLKIVIPFVLMTIVALPVIISLEGKYDLSAAIVTKSNVSVKEIAHKWNEFSRVSLIRLQAEDSTKPFYRIIHDNAESNVVVGEYRGKKMKVNKLSEVRLPFLLKRNKVLNVMVMFAGCGKQMIDFHALGGGKKKLVGVEINPLVMEFATQTPELANYRIQEFYDLPNVHMHAEEGRSFLDHDNSKYDVIYVGSNAATFKYKTGHSRKYLDTTEAMEVYWDHLYKKGLLIFRCQPSVDKINSFKYIFNKQDIGKVEDHIVVMGTRINRCSHLIVSKIPFTQNERDIIVERYGKNTNVLYSKGYSDNNKAARKFIESPLAQNVKLVTDNRPFLWMLDFKGYQPFPSIAKLNGTKYYRTWLKITTLIVVLLITFIILGSLYLTKTKMPPANMMVYLLITGFCYMLVEIAYISKLELFLENPLYSMALLLSIFLLTNGAGSILYNKYKTKLNMNLIPVLVAGIVLVSMFVIDGVISQRLGMPLPLKIFITVLIISPVGVCLGLFYPYVVTWLADNDKPESVPITYGVSTLSSVAGATYTMTMIINFGYNIMLVKAAIGYGLLALFLFVRNKIKS